MDNEAHTLLGTVHCVLAVTWKISARSALLTPLEKLGFLGMALSIHPTALFFATSGVQAPITNPRRSEFASNADGSAFRSKCLQIPASSGVTGERLH